MRTLEGAYSNIVGARSFLRFERSFIHYLPMSTDLLSNRPINAYPSRFAGRARAKASNRVG